MTTDVIAADRDSPLTEIVELLRCFEVAAIPVVDDTGGVLGIITESDLVRRVRLMAAPRHLSWWQTEAADRIEISKQYLKARGLIASEAMTAPAITVTEDASLTGIARLFERARIKRAPVVRAGILVGIVSRTNLLQALMIDRGGTRRLCSREDRQIRDAFLTRLPQQTGLRSYPVNVVVSDGVVYLRGTVTSTVEAASIRRAAETTPGVRAVEDCLVPATPCRRAKG